MHKKRIHHKDRLFLGFQITFCFLDKLESAKKKSKASEIGLKASIDLAWLKLNKYYKLTDKSTAYAMIVVLNPRMKMEYVRKYRRNFKGKLRVKYGI